MHCYLAESRLRAEGGQYASECVSHVWSIIDRARRGRRCAGPGVGSGQPENRPRSACCFRPFVRSALSLAYSAVRSMRPRECSSCGPLGFSAGSRLLLAERAIDPPAELGLVGCFLSCCTRTPAHASLPHAGPGISTAALCGGQDLLGDPRGSAHAPPIGPLTRLARALGAEVV